MSSLLAFLSSQYLSGSKGLCVVVFWLHRKVLLTFDVTAEVTLSSLVGAVLVFSWGHQVLSQGTPGLESVSPLRNTDIGRASLVALSETV